MTILFHSLAVAAIIAVLVQMDYADQLDRLTELNWFWRRVRRSVFILELMALCWVVIFGATNRWAPWPPLIAFIGAVVVKTVVHILILRWAIRKLRLELSNT